MLLMSLSLFKSLLCPHPSLSISVCNDSSWVRKLWMFSPSRYVIAIALFWRLTAALPSLPLYCSLSAVSVSSAFLQPSPDIVSLVSAETLLNMKDIMD